MPRERTLRKLTVTTRSSWPTSRLVPQVRMSGAYLARVGFTPGTVLDVAVSHGVLVISVARFAGGPDPVTIKKAVEELQREWKRRFPERLGKD